jgi:DNA repair protein RadC
MEFKVKYFYLKVSDNTIDTFIKTPEIVREYVKDEFDYSEKMVCLGMNVKNKIIIKKDVAIGSYNVVMCTPADIFIPLLKVNARNFVLVHNHPSADSSPSREDITFTKKVQKAAEYIGLNFIDHIIVTTIKEDYYSFKKNNIL